jgi:acetolactate synthase-1/2/3 large subunit
MSSTEATPTGIAIAEVLADAGISHVFAVPGGYSIKIIEGLRTARDRIQVIRAPHEHTASVMADMYGRLTGKPGVYTGQGPFVGSSGGFGLMEGFLSGTPMLLLSEMTDHGMPQHAPTQGTTGDYGAVDLPKVLSGMTKYLTVATTPNEAVHGVELAIHHAISGRPGPAAVLLRLEAAFGKTDPKGRMRLHGRPRVASIGRPHPDPTGVEAVATLLSRAERPVVVAGNGIHAARAYAGLAALADRAGTPVLTTQKARGVIADTHDFAAGPMGAFGSQAGMALLHEADAVLILASRANPSDTIQESASFIDPSRQTLVQVDIEARNIGISFPVDHGIVSDVGLFLDALLPHIELPEARVAERRAWLRVSRSAHPDPLPEVPSTPIKPQRVVGLLNEHLPAEHRVVTDAGNNRIFSYHYLNVRTPGRYHLCGGHLGMGWGAPAALTAGLLHPDERVLCITGDGGFLMSLHCLSTAAEYDLPITFLVLNNRLLGNVYDFQGEAERYVVDIPDTDFAAIARSFGIEASRVSEEGDFVEALEKSLTASGPRLIEVAVDPGESSSLARVRDPARG